MKKTLTVDKLLCAECNDGRYGQNCSTLCSPSCSDLCNKVTGECTCRPGLQPPLCLEGKPFTYGLKTCANTLLAEWICRPFIVFYFWFFNSTLVRRQLVLDICKRKNYLFDYKYRWISLSSVRFHHLCV